MKALIQRVKFAKVEVEQKVVGKIDTGILLFLAIEKQDDPKQMQEKNQKLLDKILQYRVFPDEHQKLNLSLKDIGGELLIVSQFTLAASTKKGLRPSFSNAAQPEIAKEFYDHFVSLAKTQYEKIACGEFAANMQVTLQNDGPLTFSFDL